MLAVCTVAVLVSALRLVSQDVLSMVPVVWSVVPIDVRLGWL